MRISKDEPERKVLVVRTPSAQPQRAPAHAPAPANDPAPLPEQLPDAPAVPQRKVA